MSSQIFVMLAVKNLGSDPDLNVSKGLNLDPAGSGSSSVLCFIVTIEF
jgi:hypothetical protein